MHSGDLDSSLSEYRRGGLLKHVTSSEISVASRHCVLSNAVYSLEQIVLGLLYLESIGVHHGDIKGKHSFLLCAWGKST
jgi:serine/threonine protein kinase